MVVEKMLVIRELCGETRGRTGLTSLSPYFPIPCTKLEPGSFVRGPVVDACIRGIFFREDVALGSIGSVSWQEFSRSILARILCEKMRASGKNVCGYYFGKIRMVGGSAFWSLFSCGNDIDL